MTPETYVEMLKRKHPKLWARACYTLRVELRPVRHRPRRINGRLAPRAKRRNEG